EIDVVLREDLGVVVGRKRGDDEVAAAGGGAADVDVLAVVRELGPGAGRVGVVVADRHRGGADVGAVGRVAVVDVDRGGRARGRRRWRGGGSFDAGGEGERQASELHGASKSKGWT